MTTHTTADLRNIALVGHGASGKTTLADLLLHKTGVAARAGSVDDGSSLLDFDDDEKHHKYTIHSSLVHVEHAGKRVNILDTPGYPDFIGQAVGALRAVETALVVVNAASGLEVNTRRLFQRATTARLGRMIVINKFDHDNVDAAQLVSQIQETFGANCVPLNVPVGQADSFSGVVSTLTVPAEKPADTPIDPAEINSTLMDAIVEADEELMMRYLEGETIAPAEIAAGMTKAISAGTLVPILFTSSKTDVGVSELLDAITSYALSPLQLTRTARKGDDEVELTTSADDELVAQVFKNRVDPFVGKMTFIRVFQGQLTKDSAVNTGEGGKPVKISMLMDVQGAKHDTIDHAGPGDIIATVKQEDLHVGNTLSKSGDYHLAPIPFPVPMIGLAVEPATQADQQKISGALHKVEEEDPTFHVTRDAQTKEMVMHGLSDLHLKVIEERLQSRDKVGIITHQPKIPYRETVLGAAEGHYRHKKQSGGSGQFAEVHLRVSACPQDVNPDEYFVKDNFASLRDTQYDPERNFAFLDRVSGGSVPNQFIPAVAKGVKERMDQGVLAGYHVQDVCCELFFGKDHPVDSNETAFKMAASACFRDVFKQAKPALLEPIVTLEVTVPDDKVGDASGDLSTRRGRPEGLTAAAGFTTITAKVPLSELMTYGRDLSSLTGGQGSYHIEPSHYEMVPPQEQAKIIAAANHTEDEDA